MALRDWPVSWRLIALIVLALVMGLVFGGLRVAAATDSAAEFGRVSQLAQLGERVTALVQALQDERDETAGIVPAPNPAAAAALLQRWYSATDGAAGQVRTLAARVDGSFPANIQSRVTTVLSEISGLNELRRTVQESQSALAVLAGYAAPIDDMITLTGQTAEGTNDSGLTTGVQALSSLAMAKDQVAKQRALLFNALTQQIFADGELQALMTAVTDQAADTTSFGKAATPAQENALRTTVTGTLVNKAELIENFVISVKGLDLSTQLHITKAAAPAQWYTAMSDTVHRMQTVEEGIAGSVVQRSLVLKRDAEHSALLIAILTAVALLLVLIATVAVARSLVRPLRKLRESALTIATVHLPERIKQLSEAQDDSPSLTVAPIDVRSADEIGQVARAFDQVHTEAIRLAGNEAILRNSLNAMFVNLSRRSQLLIERLARIIDSLEQSEDDPSRLADLFTMDHMVTRMRRNSENLLLLAGHESTRKWSEPVSLADVTRAATSEIEQYSRVTQRIHPDIAVSGRAASDVVHLLAEIVENATIFSAKDTVVQVSAERLTSGGVLVQVSDSGVGIPEARLAEMNTRLDDPPAIDISVSRHMGLFAVARLADRHGVRVRLLAGQPRGLNALVWLPDAIIEREARPAPWLDRTMAGNGGAGAKAGNGIGTASHPPAGVRPAAARESIKAAARSNSPWFRSRRPSAAPAGAAAATAPSRAVGWADRRQMPAVPVMAAEPVSGDYTAAGLPMRVPKANLMPGSAAGFGADDAASGQEPSGQNASGQDASGQNASGQNASGQDASGQQTLSQPADSPPQRLHATGLPQRTPDLARNRLSGFQRGIRRARSAPSTRERIVD